MKNLEVHEHSFVSGPRSKGGYGPDGKWQTGKFTHSHPGGNEMHQHPHTGPGAYVIDRDEWARTTGLRGGGKKKFTAKPAGEQFERVECEDWQKTFELHIGPPPTGQTGEQGPGVALPVRMILAFGMKISKIEEGR